MQFSRPEYWRGQPFPTPRALPNSRIKPRSPTLQVDSLQVSHKGSPRTLEWLAYPFSSGSSQPRNQTGVSCIASGLFNHWAIREVASQVARWLKNPPGHAGDVGSITGSAWEGPLEKEMPTHSSILAWRIPQTEKPDGLQSTGSQRVRCDLGTKQSG